MIHPLRSDKISKIGIKTRIDSKNQLRRLSDRAVQVYVGGGWVHGMPSNWFESFSITFHVTPMLGKFEVQLGCDNFSWNKVRVLHAAVLQNIIYLDIKFISKLEFYL